MTSESSTDREFSLPEFLRHVRRRRWLVLTFFLLGALISIPVAGLYANSSSKSVTLRVYASGTPTDSQDQVLDQLNSNLAAAGFDATQAREDGTLLLRFSHRTGDDARTSEKLAKLKEQVSAFQQRLDAKVQSVFSRVRDAKLSGEQEENLGILIQFDSYLQGRKDGMIELVRIVTKDHRPTSAVMAAIVVLITLAFGGIGLLLSMALPAARG